MKKSSRYIALTAAVLVLFGCTQEEILLQYDGKEVPITLSKVEVEGTVTTRATTTLLEEGSVGLFVKDTDVPDDSKYNAQNCHFEYENGAWKFVAEDGNTRPLYNYSELLGFSMQWAWAYSPYVADIDNAPAIELQATQTAESIAAQEKYLFTPSSEQVDENGSVSINFRHALSKVRVVVNKILPEDVDVSSIKSVTLSNILDKTAWDFTLDKAIGLKAPDDAVYTGTTTMYKVSDTEFEAVVLPCENTGSFNITLETTEGRKFVATVNYPNHANKDGFQSNYIYNVPVVVGVERISIGTVFVMPWTDVEDPIDAGTATEPEATYSISGTTATITVPAYASAASVQAAITAVAADASVTTITVNGTLTDAQQTALATGLTGYSGTLILDNMSSDDVTVDALKNMAVVYNGYVLDSTTNTYQVYTANGLYAWATKTAEDVTTNLTLMADITLPNKDLTSGADITVTDGKPSGSNWTPVGMSSYYKGSIDGNGKTITGLCIYSASKNIGFVSQLGENGNIKDLHLDDVAVYSDNQIVGGVVGKVWNTAGDISGCTVSGSVMSNRTLVGGIVGSNSSQVGIITNCANHATVTGRNFVGGIVGEMKEKSITNCTNTGTVTATFSQAGGIAGSVQTDYDDSTPLISGCFNSGKVTSTNETYKENGGIVGEISTSSWTIIACVNTGEVENGAGIVGNNGGAVIACYTTQNSVVVTNQAGYDPDIYEGSIMGTYYLGGDDSIEGTNGVSDLNTDEVVTTMNDAISTWNASNENACAYQWKVGMTYPELVANTAN